jgi:predicted O-linked N-acetylglucosamine transferase (SPINDLY family)
MKPAKKQNSSVSALLQATLSAQLFQEAMARFSKGNNADAVPLFEKALAARPDNAQALHFLGLACHQLKHSQRALVLLRNSIQAAPDQASFYINFAMVLNETGNPNEALAVLNQAPIAAQSSPDFFNALGQVRQQLGHIDAAIESFQQALNLRPNFPFALNNLGGALSQGGRFAEAVQAFELALRLIPNSPVILTNLGRARVLVGQTQSAADAFRAALSIDPANAETSLALCRLLEESGNNADALPVCDAALARHPQSAPLLIQKGELLRRMGNFSGATDCFDRAAVAQPRSFQTQWRAALALPSLYESTEQMEALRARWMAGIEQLTRDFEKGVFQGALAIPATNFYLHYQCRDDRQAQSAYGKLVAKIAAQQIGPLPPVARRTVAGRKIRVGFVSAFFNLHTISKLFSGWVTKLDRAAFETFVFHFNPLRDKATDFLEANCDHLVAGPFPLAAAAESIARAQVDILVYTDIGMDALTQALAGLRLAPVQCQTWGHPVTSGLPTMDYFLSSERMEPADGDSRYNETLIRLPGLSISYAAPDRSVAIPAPGFPESNGRVRYVCLQSLFKLLPEQDRLFADIASRVPNALFVFISHPSPELTAQYRRRLESEFRLRGVNPDGRLHFLQPLRYGEFLGLARDADVILDSVGWSGGNTTLEAIAFGAAVVTCPGPLMRGRHTAAILQHIGVDETVATSERDYVDIAVRCAENRPWRAAIKQRVLDRAPLAYSNNAPIRALEQFILDRV